MTRRMSPSRRARIFAAADGVRHICGQTIDGTRDRWEVEHVIPYAMTRDDSDDNLRPAHAACHAKKTPQDVAQIAKAKRVNRKHNGAHRPKTTIDGSKSSKWKKRMDGTAVRRD